MEIKMTGNWDEHTFVYRWDQLNDPFLIPSTNGLLQIHPNHPGLEEVVLSTIDVRIRGPACSFIRVNLGLLLTSGPLMSDYMTVLLQGPQVEMTRQNLPALFFWTTQVRALQIKLYDFQVNMPTFLIHPPDCKLFLNYVPQFVIP